ncbi:12955_t:CDS:1, partial [Racocetra persica]
MAFYTNQNFEIEPLSHGEQIIDLSSSDNISQSIEQEKNLSYNTFLYTFALSIYSL